MLPLHCWLQVTVNVTPLILPRLKMVRSEPCVNVRDESTGGEVVVPTYVDGCRAISRTKASI